MLRWLALLGLIGVTACADLDGARLVRYADSDRFYLRHSALYGDGTVAAMAAQLCGEDDRKAQLVSAEQYYPFDIRYATYACIAPEE